MKTIQQLKNEHEDKLSAIFDKLGIFFAFSDWQFDEQKKEGVEYIGGGYGMVLPKANVDEWVRMFDEHTKQCEKDYADNVPLEEYIKYELANHECYYTSEYSEALEPVQLFYPDCTIEDVRKVYFKQLMKEEAYV